MNNFERNNNLLAWLSMGLATVVYLVTLEPSVSFWDCGEFIASAYKLEVGHPPGAPLYMLLARVFSLLALGHTEWVAWAVNALSAVASGFTVLFLFWSITHYARRMVQHAAFEAVPPVWRQALVLGSGATGALLFAFSDTFWFSAVEAEVYALSSFFTAIVFWLALKWDNRADQAHADRYLVLIAYLMGLSIGVHLLNLLAIPAIVYVVYFRRFRVTMPGFLLAGLAGVGILAVVQYGIIPGIPYWAAQFDLLFVNTFGWPFFSGVLFYLAGLVLALVLGIALAQRFASPALHLGFTMLLVMLIGYSSFAVIVLRSQAKTPMNENAPDNMFALLSYLNRDQYGDRPLLYGQYYNAPIEAYSDGAPIYARVGNRYVLVDRKRHYEYAPEYSTLFPRMYSSLSSHVSAYRSWAEIDRPRDQVPSFGENVLFFLRYQLDHMYLRYLFWNFAGRQNDLQGHGNRVRGNWQSGLAVLDQLRAVPVGPGPLWWQHNAAHNRYFLLPFVLGVLGALVLWQHSQRALWSMLLFFLFTGVAIILYLNQTPYQPRERDYAFAGSFYAWALFAGLGVVGVFRQVQIASARYARAGVALSIALGLGLAAWMLYENFDDHNRAHRYTTHDWAKNYLDSCEPDAILFTYGDNDTFPLWYLQEVEGYRTDVRVVNLSLLGTDWNIAQMQRRSYLSAPLPLTMRFEQYMQGTRDIVPLYEQLDQHTDLRTLLGFVLRDDAQAKVTMRSGEAYNYLPTKKFRLAVDTAAVLANGTVRLPHRYPVLPELQWQVANNYFTKSELAIVDLLATNRWQRPIYFACSIGQENMFGLDKYLRLEGFAYRLVPQARPDSASELGWIDPDLLYQRLMKQFAWGGMQNPNVYIDQQNIRTARLIGIHELFVRLARALVQQNDQTRAAEVLGRLRELMPYQKFPIEAAEAEAIDLAYQTGNTPFADNWLHEAWREAETEVNFYLQLSPDDLRGFASEKDNALYLLQALLETARKHQRNAALDLLHARMDALIGPDYR